MLEEERLLVVNKIKRNIAEKELLKEKYEKLQELTSDPKVSEYLALSREINRIENNQRRFNSKEDMINLEFTCAFGSFISNNKYSPCKHEVWLYEGSYYLYLDPWGEHDHYLKTYTEKHKAFEYNKYICLECKKTIQTKEWKKFEQSHKVLKFQNKKELINVHFFINLYYQLLYENSVESAKKMVIEEYNKQIKKKRKLLKL